MDRKPSESSQNASEDSSSSDGGITQKATLIIKIAVDEHMRTLFKTSKAHRVSFEFITDQFYCKCGRVLSDEKPARRLADEGAVSVSLSLAYYKTN